MYSPQGTTPLAPLSGGRSYLCLGPPMAGMDGLFASLIEPRNDSDATIAVLTDTNPEWFLERLSPHEGPVAVIDCTGGSADAEKEDDPLYRRVSSPADLTSIGIDVMELLEAFTDRGLSVRVGLDSLTTLSVYAEDEQLFAFLNTLEPKVTDREGLFIAALYTQSVEERVQSRVEPLFDGCIELRESSTGSEVRMLSPGEEPAAWEAFDGEGLSREPDTSTARDTAETPTIESLGELIHRIEASRLTLSVYNPGDADLGPLRTRMDRLNVALESIETPNVPHNVAMLHRDGEFIVAEPLGSLLSSLSLDELRNAEAGLSPIIEHVDSRVTGVSGVAKPLLIRASRMFELLAYRTGQGTLHAGFQELTRFADDDHVTRLYEGIAGAGVDVRLYGAAGPDISMENVTVIEDDCEEIAESWFVVFDGPDRTGALVSEERDPSSYHGFWTHRRELVEEVADYLEATY